MFSDRRIDSSIEGGSHPVSVYDLDTGEKISVIP